MDLHSYRLKQSKCVNEKLHSSLMRRNCKMHRVKLLYVHISAKQKLYAFLSLSISRSYSQPPNLHVWLLLSQ